MLQQDGAGAHTLSGSGRRAKTRELLEKTLFAFGLKGLSPRWPANSPDLSSIEEVRALMKKRLQARGR
jgi:hypothetical protein